MGVMCQGLLTPLALINQYIKAKQIPEVSRTLNCTISFQPSEIVMPAELVVSSQNSLFDVNFRTLG